MKPLKLLWSAPLLILSFNAFADISDIPGSYLAPNALPEPLPTSQVAESINGHIEKVRSAFTTLNPINGIFVIMTIKDDDGQTYDINLYENWNLIMIWKKFESGSGVILAELDFDDLPGLDLKDFKNDAYNNDSFTFSYGGPVYEYNFYKDNDTTDTNKPGGKP